MPLIDTLNNFRASIAEVNSFIALAFQQDANNNYLLPTNQRDFITNSAFLKLFIGWEAFLEDSFTKYLMGELSIQGNVVLRYANPIDEQHARNLLIGTQKYVDWANPEIVRRLSKLYLATSNPIDTTLSSINADLFDLKTIRNAAAHLSSSTNQPLDSLSSRKLGVQCHNMSVSDLIFAVDPSSSPNTILTTYLNILDVAAEAICNG